MIKRPVYLSELLDNYPNRKEVKQEYFIKLKLFHLEQ